MAGTRRDTSDHWQAESRAHEVGRGEPAGWGAGLVFAGVMLGVVGLFELIAGLTALVNDDFYVVRSDELVISLDYTVWGWAHLLFGVLALVTSYLLLRGSRLGLTLGIVVAALVAVVNLLFLAAHPWWAILAIAFNVLVIYAISRHGEELQAHR